MLFCAVFVDYMCVYYSVGLYGFRKLGFEIRATLHCFKTNNYKFKTMLHL